MECRNCLLRELANEDYHMIEKYKAAIKEADRVTKEVYEKRLKTCKECQYLNKGTCAACGCYVELRGLGKEGKCPYKKW